MTNYLKHVSRHFEHRPWYVRCSSDNYWILCAHG